MQTHHDDDQKQWDRLRKRAVATVRDRQSVITAGEPGERALSEWQHAGDDPKHPLNVRQMPDDEQGIIRISVGGGVTWAAGIDYCVFRGDPTRCAYMLERAAEALRNKPR